jgi:hypothetical protein
MVAAAWRARCSAVRTTMKLSLRFIASLGAVVLACGCAHAPPRRPKASTATVTSAFVRGPAYDASMKPGLEYRPTTNSIDVDRDASLEQWSARYPDASHQLADWMGQYAGAAAKMAEWGAANPIQMRTLVDWAATRRYEPLNALLYGRSGWSELRRIALVEEPDGVNELIAWIRRSPHAAVELTQHTNALAWSRLHASAPEGHVAAAPHSMVSVSPP